MIENEQPYLRGASVKQLDDEALADDDDDK
jgi:hypothetical protein